MLPVDFPFHLIEKILVPCQALNYSLARGIGMS